MPSITPSYLYTFVALVAVSSLLVFSFMAYASAFRVSSEARQLTKLMNCMAAKSTELLTLTLTTNATAETFVQMPAAIGDRQYWIRFRNDSVEAWLEGGLGNTPTEGTELRIYLPKQTSVTGCYIGGYGAARLKCYLDAGVPQIQLSSSSEGD